MSDLRQCTSIITDLELEIMEKITNNCRIKSLNKMIVNSRTLKKKLRNETYSKVDKKRSFQKNKIVNNRNKKVSYKKGTIVHFLLLP